MIVCGSRHGAAGTYVADVLSFLHEGSPIGTIVTGNAAGVDAQAIAWAVATGVPNEGHPADWSLGKKAGPLRNARMAALGADLLVAFDGGKGTRNMVSQASQKKIPVFDPFSAWDTERMHTLFSDREREATETTAFLTRAFTCMIDGELWPCTAVEYYRAKRRMTEEWLFGMRERYKLPARDIPVPPSMSPSYDRTRPSP